MTGQESGSTGPQHPADTLTDDELKATTYFAVGVSSEGIYEGRNVAYELRFAGYIHHEGERSRSRLAPIEPGTYREGQLEPIANSGYTIGTLQTDFGQQRNDQERNQEQLLDAYSVWANSQATTHPGLSLTSEERQLASTALQRQGREIRGDRTTTTDNGFDVPPGIKSRIDMFLATDAGISFVHNQDIKQADHLVDDAQGPIRQLEGTTLYLTAPQEDRIRMATVFAKLGNQSGNSVWPGIIDGINTGDINSIDKVEAAVPAYMHADRDNALRGAELLISLRNSDTQNSLNGAWQDVMANPLVNPTQLDQDQLHPNLKAEYSTIKNLFLIPDQGKAFVQALDKGGQRAREIHFRGASQEETAGFYVSGNDFVQWNRDGRGTAYVGDQWSEIERSQITRTKHGDITDLSITSDGITTPLLHVDPKTPMLRPSPAATTQEQRVPANPGPQTDPNHRDHPNHALLNQIRGGVRAIDEGLGKPYDEASERLSRAGVAACRDNREMYPGKDYPLASNALDRADHVLMGGNGNLFIVQGDLRDPAHRRATVNVEQAINTPVEQSDQKLLAANQTIDKQLVQARQQQLTPALDTPTQKGPMLA